MRRLILICLMILPAGMCQPRVEYRTIEAPIPESLIAEVPRPDRPLVTYKDAVLRDAERGAVIDQMNDDRAAIRRIFGVRQWSPSVSKRAKDELRKDVAR